MTAAQRLLLGIVAGSLVTLLSFPATRSLLLHVPHRAAVARALQADPLTRPPGPLPDPPSPGALSTPELGREALLIARRAYRDPGARFSLRDYEIARQIAAAGETADPTNAFWPLFQASVAEAAGIADDSNRSWQRAANKRIWRSQSPNLVQSLWRELAKAEGWKLAWQGLFANLYRPSEAALLAVRAGEARLGAQPVSREDWRSRLLLVVNLGLVRDGSTSVRAGSAACEVILRAFQTGSEWPPSTPLTAEQQRTRFVNAVGELFGSTAAQRVSTEWRQTVGWQPLVLTPEERASKLAQATIVSVMAASLPSVLVFSGAIMAGVAAIGLALRGFLGGVPHPDGVAIAFAGVALASLVLLISGTWLLSVWVLFAISMLAIPITSAPAKPIELTGGNKLMLRLYATLATGLVAFWLYTVAPSTLLISKTFPAIDRFTASDWPENFAILGVTAALPIAAMLAYLKQRAMFFTLGEMLVRVGIWGTTIGVVGGVLLTPICLYADETSKPFVEILTANEVEAYKITRP